MAKQRPEIALDLDCNPEGRESLDWETSRPRFSLVLFQSTRPWKPRLGAGDREIWTCHFNPRGRESLDDVKHFWWAHTGWFQSTRPWKPRLLPFNILLKVCNISIHEAVKASTVQMIITVFARIRFQSTRPWKPRRFSGIEIARAYIISIHEAVKASTLTKMRDKASLDISIHEAVKASTFSWHLFLLAVGFQSTRPWKPRRFHARIVGNS